MVKLSDKKKITPMRAIRMKCLECSAGQAAEVRKCPVVDCALWPYRMGHRPKMPENQTNP